MQYIHIYIHLYKCIHTNCTRNLNIYMHTHAHTDMCTHTHRRAHTHTQRTHVLSDRAELKKLNHMEKNYISNTSL